MAERTVEAGATKAVIVYIDSEGDRIAVSLPDMSALETAGLLSLAIADFAANPIEDIEEIEG
ncbi:hypothetical protein [Falsiroseomonas sp. CW058]|uniref:hypothetical protein n=1 Tax=Falsiroseomonas sp. CW058 TaxID=3388664 RepID=UPI003D31D26C